MSFDFIHTLKFRKAIKTLEKLFLTPEQKCLLKVQRSSSVLDSSPEDSSMKRLVASLDAQEVEREASTFDLLTSLVNRKE